VSPVDELSCERALEAPPSCQHQRLLQRLSTVHSYLAPIDDSASLEHAVERAYLDVFGPGRDAAILRRLFLTNYPRPAGMPDAHAAILAAHEFVPEAAASLLDRIRHHYHRARTAA
jgi:hypothetical protein